MLENSAAASKTLERYEVLHIRCEKARSVYVSRCEWWIASQILRASTVKPLV